MIELIGESKEIQTTRHLIAQVANTRANVLILGESGTGKELIARLVHSHSDRLHAPFIAVNCAAIPCDLLESELFGHEKGAFTGAHIMRPGRFELAVGGTIFLDEIGDMPLAMQAKLLRVLQERQVERVGGTKAIETDVRVIAATNKNLEEALKTETFREDLYYRLNVFPIVIPPLRDRKEDIPILLNYFLNQFQLRENTQVTLSESALERLIEYAWPGNIRELINLSERLVILLAGKTIQPSDLPAMFFKTDKKPSALTEVDVGCDEQDDDKTLTILRAPSFNLKAHMIGVELNLIHKALEANQWVVSRAARELGLQRTTLVEKMKRHGILRG